MSGLEIALVAVIATLLLAGVGVGAFFYFRWRAKQAVKMTEAVAQLSEVVGKYQGSLELYLASIGKAKSEIEMIPALMSGMLKIAQAEVKEISAFRAEVKNFRELVFRKEGNRVDVPSDTEKDFVFRANELAQSKGIGFEQALRQVIEEDAREGLAENVEFTL